MAGTGHEYEVVNIDRVVAALGSFASAVPYPEGKAWFGTPRLLRYVTAPTFVARIAGREAEEAIAGHVADPCEREILLRKLSEGRDLRMFVPEFLERLGPDLGHVADWIAALPKDDPRMVPKLRKVDVAAAVLHAGRWVSRMARKAAIAGRGTVEVVCDADSGRIWVELKDEDALSAEGWRMSHCVYGYGSHLAAGTRIFSLRITADRPVVTVELVPVGGRMAVRQVKGFGNKAPLPRYFRDIAEFLNHMGIADQDGRDVSGLGILRDPTGHWRLIHEVAKRIDVAGMAGYSNGREMHLVSPIDPERMVAVVTELPEWASVAGNRKQTLISGAGDARFHTLTEQRAIARLASEMGIEKVKDLPYLVPDGAGGWLPWVDTCLEWRIGEARFLTRDDAVYLMNESMRDILVAVAPGTVPGLDDLVAKVAAGQREWSAGEVRNLAAVLDFLGVERLEDPERSLSRAGLHSGPRGRWFRFRDVAVEHPCAYESPDGRRLRWLVAPYRIALCEERGELAVAHRDEHGRVHCLTGAWSSARDLMAEACRLLNDLGIVAAPEYASRYVSAPRWTEADKGEGYAVVCLGGVWRVVDSWRGLLAALRKVGRTRYRDGTCFETAIRLLPEPGADPDADRAMARYLAGWAAKAGKHELYMQDYVFHKDRPLESGEGRLRAAAGLIDHLAPGERKAVAKAVETMMRNVMGSSRSPKGLFSISRQERIREFMLLFRHDLGAKFLGRAVAWSLWALSNILTEEKAAAKIDARWFEVFERVQGNRRARSAIREAAMSTYWRLKTHPENVSIADPKDVDDWVRCLETAYFWCRSDIVKALGVLDETVASRHSGEEWEQARARIADALGRHVEVPRAA